MAFNRNYKGNYNNNRDNYQQNDRSNQRLLGGIDMSGLLGLGSIGTSTREKNESNRPRREEPKKDGSNNTKNSITLNKAIINDMINDFKNNKTNGGVIFQIIQTQFPTVCEIMNHYYEGRYTDVVESMNNVLTLMSTETFATSLLTVVKDETYPDWDSKKRQLAVVIGLALDTQAGVMHEDTISAYVEIVTEWIYPLEIKELHGLFGISEDAACDIVMNMPLFGTELNDVQIRTYAQAFFNVVVNTHYDTMIDTMTAENMIKLFYYIFPAKNNQALKIAGRCLAEAYVEMPDEKQKALYMEYVKMLYMILDDNDIMDIKMSLRFIVKELGKRKDLSIDGDILFKTEDAIEFTNLKKAIVAYVEQDEKAKEFLV